MNIQPTRLVVAGFALAAVACSGDDVAEPVSGPSETTASSPTFSAVAVDSTCAGNDPTLDEFSTYLTGAPADGRTEFIVIAGAGATVTEPADMRLSLAAARGESEVSEGCTSNISTAFSYRIPLPRAPNPFYYGRDSEERHCNNFQAIVSVSASASFDDRLVDSHCINLPYGSWTVGNDGSDGCQDNDCGEGFDQDEDDEDEEEKCWGHRLLDNGHIGYVEVECND